MLTYKDCLNIHCAIASSLIQEGHAGEAEVELTKSEHILKFDQVRLEDKVQWHIVKCKYFIHVGEGKLWYFFIRVNISAQSFSSATKMAEILLVDSIGDVVSRRKRCKLQNIVASGVFIQAQQARMEVSI